MGGADGGQDRRLGVPAGARRRGRQLMRPEVRQLALEAGGWPSELEGGRLFELAREVAPRGPAVEIGGFGRRSALFIAEGCREAEGYPVFCIDHQPGCDTPDAVEAPATPT